MGRWIFGLCLCSTACAHSAVDEALLRTIVDKQEELARAIEHVSTKQDVFAANLRDLKQVNKDTEQIKVLASARSLRAGDMITRDALTVIEVPKFLVTQSVVTVHDLERGTPVLGRKLIIEINTGDMLLYQHVGIKDGD
jgi:hypothetical protein